jgi:hypothetical protein
MTRALSVLIVVGVIRIASADDAPPSQELARHSTTLFLGTTWSPGPTVPIRVGGEAALRVQRARLAFEARFGAGGAGSVIAASSVFNWHVGAGLGVALTLGGHVVLTPLVGYDLFGMLDGGGARFAVHYFTLGLPVAIALRRGVVLEVFTQVGATRGTGIGDVAIVVGPRIGIVL